MGFIGNFDITFMLGALGAVDIELFVHPVHPYNPVYLQQREEPGTEKCSKNIINSICREAFLEIHKQITKRWFCDCGHEELIRHKEMKVV